jgi:hypothetical protein
MSRLLGRRRARHGVGPFSTLILLAFLLVNATNLALIPSVSLAHGQALTATVDPCDESEPPPFTARRLPGNWDEVPVGGGGKLFVEIGKNFSPSLEEFQSAKFVAAQGKEVYLRIPRGQKGSGGTTDLLVFGPSEDAGGTPYDVYSPEGDLDSAIAGGADKMKQINGGVLVLNLSRTSLTPADIPSNFLDRVNHQTPSPSGPPIRGLVVVPKGP